MKASNISKLKFLIFLLVIFVLIYFIEGALSTFSNFLYPEKISERGKEITSGWDKALGKKLKQIAQKKKETQKAAEKAEEDKWLSAHPSRAFLTIPDVKTPPLIDGRLDDAVWRDIPRTTPFTYYKDHKIDHDFGGVNFYLRLTDLEDRPLSGIKSVLDPNVRD